MDEAKKFVFYVDLIAKNFYRSILLTSDNIIPVADFRVKNITIKPPSRMGKNVNVKFDDVFQTKIKALNK